MKSYNVREKDVETYLISQSKRRLGASCDKFNSGTRAKPDRILLWLPKNICFVECKAPGKTWTKPQGRERDRLRAKGHQCELVDSKEAVDKLLDNLELL
jgi:hypothetical protein